MDELDPELESEIAGDAMVMAFARAGLTAIKIACIKRPHELSAALAPLLDEWKLEAGRASGLLAIVQDQLSACLHRIEDTERRIDRIVNAVEMLEIALAKARQNWGRLVAAGSKDAAPAAQPPGRR